MEDRYFYFSAAYVVVDRLGFHADTFITKQFPSLDELRKLMQDSIPDCTNVVILSISEMNEEEYKIFNSIVEL